MANCNYGALRRFLRYPARRAPKRTAGAGSEEEMRELIQRMAERFERGSRLASGRAPTGSLYLPDEPEDE
jgi:hypothetical protein